jgi:hypothetical protein
VVEGGYGKLLNVIGRFDGHKKQAETVCAD